MTDEEFQREGRRLREVLKDAEARGDYYLEMDVKEALQKLRTTRRTQNEDRNEHLVQSGGVHRH